MPGGEREARDLLPHASRRTEHRHAQALGRRDPLAAHDGALPSLAQPRPGLLRELRLYVHVRTEEGPERRA
eukprot:scaffold100768_cov61-Phaeocystis_antarctica.AAC.8